MIVIMILLSFVPVINAYLLLSVLWPKNCAFNGFLPFKIVVSLGLGIGISSIINFFIVVTESSSSGFFVKDLIVNIVMFSILFLFYRKSSSFNGESLPNANSVKTPLVLKILLGVVLMGSLSFFVAQSLSRPEGKGDAVYTWNLKGHFIYHGGPYIKNLLSGIGGDSVSRRMDYPLMIPFAVARVWRYVGSLTQIVPATVGGLFTYATVVLLFIALCFLRGPTSAFIATTFLLATSYFTLLGTGQYSDIPISFFFLLTMALFGFHLKLKDIRDTRGILVLAGLSSGIAMWTKNEGVVFLGCFLVSFVLVSGFKNSLKRLPYILLGLIVPLVVYVWFKKFLAPRSEYLSVLNDWSVFKDYSRFFLLLKSMAIKIFSETRISGFFAVFALLAGFSIKKENAKTFYGGLCLVVLMWGGYIMAYFTSPYPIMFNLTNSIERLYQQVWPITLFVFFMGLNIEGISRILSGPIKSLKK
jgi:hypothetical protein